MRIITLISIISLLCLVPGSSKTETADIVFTNGNVYTVNERQPRAEAVAVKGNKSICVGSNLDAKAYQGKTTRIIDLKGRTVVPGMSDAHYHLVGVGA